MSTPDPHSIERIGDYPVRRLHAEGGQAWIFEVEDPKFGVRRALKALKPQAGPAGEYERFRREAQALAAIEHPHLVTPFDFGRDEATGCFFYTMAFIEGQSLSDRLQTGPLDAAEVWSVFVPVLDALTALHDAGFIHRDVKPSNILISSDGHAYLADLGIMVGVDDDPADTTRTGLALGSALFMSPEQARGRREDIGPASDVFSMGLALYQSVTGHTAYDDAGLTGESGREVLMYLGARVFREDELELSFDDEVPEALREVITRACRLRPEDRPSDAREMRDALAEALATPRDDGRGGIRLPSRFWSRVLPVTALLVGAVAVTWWGIRRDAAAEAESTMRVADELAASVDLLLTQASLEDSSLEIELRVAQRAAAFELETGRAYIADRLYDAASERGERAVLRFEDLCGRVAMSLQASNDKRFGALRARVGELEAPYLPAELRASETAGERFGALAGDLDAFEKPTAADRPCRVASTMQQRQARLGALTTEAVALEADVAERLPEVAEAAAREARQARGRARALSLEHRAMFERMDRAADHLREGDRARRAGESLEAVRRYAEARDLYAEVEAMAPALRAKLEYEARERRAREAQAPGLRSPGRVYDFGERLFLEGHFPEAEREYRTALELLKALPVPSPAPAAGS